MKSSPKELLVRRHVRTHTAWKGTFCCACNHRVIFELMFQVGDRLYCMDCCPTKEDAFDATFPKQITPNDIILRQEKEKVQRVLYNLLHDIDSLSDGDVSPSVFTTLLKYSPDING